MNKIKLTLIMPLAIMLVLLLLSPLWYDTNSERSS
jgi:hypothetical protein